MQLRHLQNTKKKDPDSPFWSQFSHLTQRIFMKIEERIETQEIVKFHFQAPHGS